MNNATRNDFQDWHNSFSLIITEMILCKLLISKTEIKEEFPPTMQAIKIMEEFLHGIEPEETDMINEEFENLMIDFMDNIKETIDGINIKSEESFIIMAEFFAKLKYIVEISLSNNFQDKNCLNILKYITFSYAKSRELMGYWTARMERRLKYINIQGANSREIGDISRDEVKKILKRIGGIDSYSALGYGQKKPITDEIENKLKLKDKRHVYNILKKIKSENQND